jgi:hypothetical protein
MVFIVRHEKHPVSVILELICFVLLYAAVFENFATLMKWYGYDRSVLMIFNVPASVPVMEFMVVCGGLRLADSMKMPEWCKRDLPSHAAGPLPSISCCVYLLQKHLKESAKVGYS